MSLYVRCGFSAVQLRKAVNEYLDPKVKSLTKDRQLANSLAREWGTATTKYVPRSDKTSGHHLQTFYVSDGRVTWTRLAREDDESAGISSGDEIAGRLHDEGPVRGHFHKRAEGATEYGSHVPTSQWTTKVRPDGVKSMWNAYVQKATVIIRDWMGQHGNR